MNFDHFRTVMERHGLLVLDHGNGHWKAIGDRTVNFWPSAKHGPVMHVKGERNSKRGVTIDHVLRAAQGHRKPRPAESSDERPPWIHQPEFRQSLQRWLMYLLPPAAAMLICLALFLFANWITIVLFLWNPGLFLK